MGVFEKVMLAVAILVANGVLLFVILRFLLWLAFPGMKDDAAATGARPPVAREAAPGEPGVLPTTPAPGADLPVATPARTGLLLGSTAGQRARAYPHRILIGIPVILALFLGGLWLGNVIGGPAGAAAATTVTIKVKGRIVSVNGTTKVVRVPAQTVTRGDQIVKVAGTTVTLPASTVLKTQVVRSTKTTRLPGKTTVETTTIAIPTTITDTGTTTVTETTTETVTTTDTSSSSTTT